jgi:hypothetical protein
VHSSGSRPCAVTFALASLARSHRDRPSNGAELHSHVTWSCFVQALHTCPAIFTTLHSFVLSRRSLGTFSVTSRNTTCRTLVDVDPDDDIQKGKPSKRSISKHVHFGGIVPMFFYSSLEFYGMNNANPFL